MFCGFVLKLRHAAELAHIGKAAQKPAKLRVRGYMRLIIDAVLFRIQTGRDIERIQTPGIFAECGRVLPQRQGMQIHNAVKAFIFPRETDPVFQRPEIIPKRQRPRRLHSAIQYFFLTNHNF